MKIISGQAIELLMQLLKAMVEDGESTAIFGLVGKRRVDPKGSTHLPEFITSRNSDSAFSCCTLLWSLAVQSYAYVLSELSPIVVSGAYFWERMHRIAVLVRSSFVPPCYLFI